MLSSIDNATHQEFRLFSHRRYFAGHPLGLAGYPHWKVGLHLPSGPGAIATLKNLHIFYSLLNQPVHADLTLLADSTYNLHQCIVCPQSAILAKLCQPPMQVRSLSSSSTSISQIKDVGDLSACSSPTAVKTAVVDLRHHDVLAVSCMVQFFYRMTYDPYQSSVPAPAASPRFVSKVSSNQPAV